jgi:catechol 2,3-dioxygenase-like lactoylglutathione lyase family enzyme
MRDEAQRYVGGEMLLVLDCSDLDRSAVFWCEVLGYRRYGPPVGQYQTLVPASGGGIGLLLQRVADRKTTKNRLHLDLRTSRLEPEVDRILAAGAARVTAGPLVEHGFRWHVVADPDGNEFCVIEVPEPDSAGPLRSQSN